MTRTLIGISFVAVSSRPQVEEVSLQHQREVNESNASKVGAVIPPEHFLEVPGQTREYDTLFEIMEDIAAYRQLWHIVSNKQADVLFAYLPNRLARTESLLMDLARKCWRHDVALYIDNMPPQTLEPRRQRADMAQKLLLAFGGVQAGDDLEVLRERHRTGMAHRVKVKKLDPGKLRYGYTYEYEGKHRHKVIDNVAAEVIRFVLLDLYVGRQLGQRAILRILNNRKLVTPSVRRAQLWDEDMPNASDKWYPGSIYEIIRCARHYAGYLEYNRRTTRTGYDTRREHTGWVKADFPPILTEEEIVLIEKEGERRSIGPRRTYPLSGLCICADCGLPMSGNMQRDRYWAETGKHYRYMRCRKCRIFVREESIADTLRDMFIYIRDNTDVEHLFQQSNDNQEAALLARIKEVTAQAEDVQASISRLVDALSDGSLPAQQIAEKLRERKQEGVEYEVEITELRQTLTELRLRPTPDEQIEEIRNDGVSIIDSMVDEPLAARQWFQRHIKQVTVYRGGECDITFY